MEQCPTCRANVSGKPACHRCGTELEHLREILSRAEQHLEEAEKAYLTGDFRQMYTHAERACALRRTPRSEIFLACAALALNRLDKACSIWAKQAAPGL